MFMNERMQVMIVRKPFNVCLSLCKLGVDDTSWEQKQRAELKRSAW